MDSRVVLDALSPPPTLFASHLRHVDHDHPIQTLRQSIRCNFPPPPAPPLSTDDMRARVIKVTSLPELQRVVLLARAQRRRLKAGVGGAEEAHHVAFLERGGVFVDTSHLRKAVLNPSRGVVVAQAGVLLSELEAQVGELAEFSQKVNFAGGGGVRSVGGAIVKGVLGGGGVTEGLLGDVVCELSFVDAFGRLRVVSDGEMSGVFCALKLSLGMFGIVYDVTLRVNACRRVARVTSLFLPMRGSVAGGVSRVVRNALEKKGGAEIIWVPFNSWMKWGTSWTPEEDVVWVRTLERVVEGRGKPSVELDEEFDVAFRFLTPPQWLSLNATRLEREGYRVFQPEHMRMILGLGFEDTAWKLESKPYVQSYAHAVRYQDNADAFPVVEVAVAFPLRPSKEEDWDTLQDAWKVVMRKVAEYDVKRKYPLNVAMKTAFVKASDALLAPNFAYTGQGRRSSCSAVVKIMSAKNTMGWRQFARDVVEAWMLLPRSRCHVSREVAAICSADTIVASLGESLRAFKSLRKNAAVDDYGMFLDEQFANLLGIHAQGNEFSSSPVSSVVGCERNPLRLREVDGLLDLKVTGESRGVGNHTCAADDKRERDRDGRELNDTPPATASLPNLYEAPASKMSGLRTSLVPLETSPVDDDAGYSNSDGYESDNDESSNGDSDDTSVTGETRRLISSTWSKPRYGTRRRKAEAGNQISPPSPEYLLLLTCIVLCMVIWLLLFGESALRRLGWML